MPAKNPRLTITLKPPLAAQLRRLSELTGNSQSSMIGEMLEGSGPVFSRMIQVLEAAEAVKESMRGKIAGDIEHAQTRMEEGLGILHEGFDEFTGTLLNEVESAQKRANRKVGKQRAARVPVSAPTASPTPLSNRGVRSLTIATKNIAQGQSPSKPKPIKDGGKSRGVGK